ncbi:MAG: hypothetical protein A3G23_05145 [Bacteroidetes bacterium RIFCSPLOWO2_12_FULL_37_12]|nr:MAG: hypothetical protein A3G23_05145 [Bacteroidetes bacterium RIFCSPLOWO2_12_FULL_37_12]
MKLKFTLILLLNFLPFLFLSAQELRKPGTEDKNAITYENMFKDISWNTDIELLDERLSRITKALNSPSTTKEQKEELVTFKSKMLDFKIRLIDRSLIDPESTLKNSSSEKERVKILQKQKDITLAEIEGLKQY